jgi:hypothetical protein
MKRHHAILIAVVVILLTAAALLMSTEQTAENADEPGAAAQNIPNFMAGAWGLDNPGDPTQFAKVPGDPGPGPVVQHPDFPYTNDSREAARRMADTSNPILQPWVKERMDKEVARVMAGVMATRAMNEDALTGIAFIPTSRCWLGGVPGEHLYTGEVFFIQTPDQVWIIQTRDSPRRIYMNRKHSDNPQFSWFGDAVGHYQGGDTLVVDTIALDDKGPIDRVNTPHTKQLHVVERFKIVTAANGEKRMQVLIHVQDPGAFTQAWNAKVEYEHAPDAQFEEWICNENSTEYWIPPEELVPVPSATRRDF